MKLIIIIYQRRQSRPLVRLSFSLLFPVLTTNPRVRLIVLSDAQLPPFVHQREPAPRIVATQNSLVHFANIKFITFHSSPNRSFDAHLRNENRTAKGRSYFGFVKYKMRVACIINLDSTSSAWLSIYRIYISK